MSYIASPLISKIIKQENLSFNEKAITSKKFGFQVQDSNEVIFLDDRIDMCGFVEEREYTSISGSPAIIPQTYLYSKYSTTYGSFAQFGIAPMASALSNQSFTIAKSFDAGENRYQKNYTGQNVCVGPWGFYGHYYSGFTLKELSNGFLVGKYDMVISPINDIDKKTSCNYCFVNVGINDVEYYEPIDIVNGVINFHKNIGEIGKKTFGSTLLQYSSGYANNSTRDKIIETNKLLESGFLKNNIKFFKMHEYQELINSGAYSGFAHQSSTSNGYLPSPKTALDIASGLSNFLKENIPSYEYSIPSAFSDSWVTRNPFIVSTKTGIYKTIDSGAYQYYTSNDFSGFFSGKSELIAGDIFYGDFDGACNGLYSGSIISGSIQTKDSNFTSGFFRSYSGSFYGFTGNNGLFSTGIDSGIYSGNFTGSFIGYATGTFSFFNGSGDANYYGNFKSGFLRSFSIYDGKTTGSFFSGMVDNGSGYFNGYNEYLLRTGCSFSEVKENNLFEISGYFSSASYGSSGLYRGELFTGIYFSGSLVSGKHILSNDSVGFLKNYSGFVSGATGVNFAFTGDISEFIGDVSGYISGYDFDFSGKLFDFKLASSIFSGEFSGGGFGNFIYQSGIEYSISQTGFLADGWGFFKNGFVEISGFGYEKPPSINNFYITKSNNYINWQNVKIDNSSYDPSSDSYDPYNDNISCFVWNIVDREKSKALRGRKVIGCAEISCLPNGFSLTNLHCGIMFVYSEKLEDVYTNMSSNFINRISCDAIRFSYNAGGWGEYGSDNQGKFKSRYFPSNYQYGYDETWSLQYQKSGDYKKIIPLSGLFVTPECIVPNDCNQIRFYIGSFAYPHHITSGEFMFRKAGVYTVDHNG